MKVFLLLCVLFTGNVFASGKIFLQPTYSSHAKDVTPVVGFSAWEKIPLVPMGFNFFAGSGDNFQLNDETVHWRTVRTALDFLSEKWVISLGHQWIYDNKSDMEQNRYFARFTFNLWN